MGGILTLASAKGGCGKSAPTTILAVNLSAWGHTVAVIASDPNRSFVDWHRDAYEGTALTVSAESGVVAWIQPAGCRAGANWRHTHASS